MTVLHIIYMWQRYFKWITGGPRYFFFSLTFDNKNDDDDIDNDSEKKKRECLTTDQLFVHNQEYREGLR